MHRSNLGGGQKGLGLRYDGKRELEEHRKANAFATTQKERLASSHLDLVMNSAANSEDTLKCQFRVCMLTRLRLNQNPTQPSFELENKTFKVPLRRAVTGNVYLRR